MYAAALYLDNTITDFNGTNSSLSNDKRNLSTVVRSILYMDITYQFAIVCVSCIGAAILRRHLMVWAVFAPKV